MKKALATTLMISATALVVAGVSAGPAFAQAPASTGLGDVSTAQSRLSFALPDGQTSADQLVSTDYVYDFQGETATTTYHLAGGGTLVLNVSGEHYKGMFDVLDHMTGTATYTTGTVTKSYVVVGGSFLREPESSKIEEAIYFTTPNTGVASHDV